MKLQKQELPSFFFFFGHSQKAATKPGGRHVARVRQRGCEKTMGNSQFNSAKDGEGGSGGAGAGFSPYQDSITAAGAPGGFSDASFAPSSRMGAGGVQHPYAAGVPGGGSAPIAAGGAVGDAMDVESRADERGEEEEVRERHETEQAHLPPCLVFDCQR